MSHKDQRVIVVCPAGQRKRGAAMLKRAVRCQVREDAAGEETGGEDAVGEDAGAAPSGDEGRHA